MATDTEAVEALTELGLTEYEASCFVALTQLSQGTAKEISQVADVPQSRVYDVTEQLYGRGLIDVEESEPRRYFAMPVQQAIERLQREYNEHLETASDALQDLESRQRDKDGAWLIADREDVTIRSTMHIDTATEEIYLLIGHEELLETEVLDTLADARERGVTSYLEVPTEALQREIHDHVPTANVALTDLPLDTYTTDDRGPGRLLMADRETILMSAQMTGLVPDELEETGLWGSEVGHGLVAWLRPLLVARINHLEFTTAE